jgi:hypothetical protein
VLLAPHEAALHSIQENTMQVLNRNLIALALGAALVAPAAFAQAKLGPVATPTVPTKTTDATTDAAKAAGSANITSSTAATQKAMGADTNPGKGNWWQSADVDGDGKLSTTEANANAGLASRFATIDVNKDGFVTSDEYRAFYAANASQGEQHAAAHSAVVTRDVWVKLDADADSRISLAEAAANASLTGSFATMDSNSDGFVTQDEYTAYIKVNK